MKLTKNNIDQMAEKLANQLLCTAGLSNAKKIVAKIKKNLATEYKRRKTL